MTLRAYLLPMLSLAALAVFLWPLWALGDLVQIELGGVLFGLAALALLAVTFLVLDGNLLGPKQLALLGTMAALGAALRVGTGGVAGLELIFVAVILGGAAFGARFGFLLGATTILLSSLFLGGIGPWTPFQIFATAWVGAGAALVSARFGRFRIAALASYAVLASYLFGLLMNLWFWPSATGLSSSVSFASDAGLVENLGRFLSFSLVSSTLTWDTVRAVSVAAVIAVFGRAALRTLQRAKIRV